VYDYKKQRYTKQQVKEINSLGVPSYMRGAHGEVPTIFPTSGPTSFKDFTAGFFTPNMVKSASKPARSDENHGW
jgi:hypothetical protein